MGGISAAAKMVVIKTLQMEAVQIIDFTIGSTNVTPSLYTKVCKAVMDEKILVLVDAAFLANKKRKAMYQLKHVVKMTAGQFKGNSIHLEDCIILDSGVLPKKKGRQLQQQQTIVHECTHAGFDLRIQKKQTKLESEAASYVAGALFAIDRLGSNASKVTHKDADSTFAVSFAIAQKLYANGTGSTVSTEDYAALSKALNNDPVYSNSKLEEIAGYDGVDASNRAKVLD